MIYFEKHSSEFIYAWRKLRGIPFSAVTFEVSFLSVITLLPVSGIYHLKAYAVNF